MSIKVLFIASALLFVAGVGLFVWQEWHKPFDHFAMATWVVTPDDKPGDQMIVVSLRWRGLRWDAMPRVSYGGHPMQEQAHTKKEIPPEIPIADAPRAASSPQEETV